MIGDWSGARVASRELGINNSLISACCKGDSKTTKNSIFMYYNEYIKMNKLEFKDYIKEKRRKQGKRLVQLTLTGDFIKEWKSQEEASRFYNINPALISSCCNEKNKTTNGFRWMPYEDYILVTSEYLKNKINKEADHKKIVQLSKTFEFIKLWDRQVDASKFYNIQSCPIGACCKNKLKTAYGFKWMYYKDYIEKYGEII